MVPARRGAGGGRHRGGAGVRLDRYGGGAPALDRQRLHAHRRRSHPRPGDLVGLRADYGPVHRSGRDRDRGSARAVPELEQGRGGAGRRGSLRTTGARGVGSEPMSKADVCAAILWFGVTLYAIFGALYIPLAVAALGIVLRGAGFAFRHALPGPVERPASRVFGVASVLTPFFMGTVVGAIASGEVPAGGDGDPTGSWTGFLPLVTGALFVLVTAYTAAVFLVRDSGAAGEVDLRDYFARRALITAVVTGAVAVLGVIALHADGRYVYGGLTSWPGIALVILSGLSGMLALGLLVTGRSYGLRVAAVGAGTAVIWGYFAAAFPYILPTSLTISGAAGASATLTTVIVVFGVAAVTVVPSLALLYVLSQRSALE